MPRKDEIDLGKVTGSKDWRSVRENSWSVDTKGRN